MDCPECRARMDEGFIPDFTQGGALQMLWHPGTPEDQRFFGLRTGAVKVDRSEAVKVAVYRCPRCGLLRAYAKD
jgi:hypothetical protein